MISNGLGGVQSSASPGLDGSMALCWLLHVELSGEFRSYAPTRSGLDWRRKAMVARLLPCGPLVHVVANSAKPQRSALPG